LDGVAEEFNFICNGFFHALERFGPPRTPFANGSQNGAYDNRTPGRNF
jgi:hypothetical protein